MDVSEVFKERSEVALRVFKGCSKGVFKVF